MHTNTTNTTNISMKKTYDIHERIYKFIVRVIILVNKLPKTPSNLVIISQLLKSVTSMGANDQEADGTLTKKDFINKFGIVRKEGKETIFWLRLIADTNSEAIKKEALKILAEGEEIVAIISSILNKTRNK
jgi:four helix bundle protein